MKHKLEALPLYPFLLAVYPVLAIYSRNLGEVLPYEIVRPLYAFTEITDQITESCPNQP
jgi:hypothetical protein